MTLLLLLFAWLAWSRYLYHKEFMALQDRGGNLGAFLEMAERRRIRWGIIIGVIMLILGAAIALGALLYGLYRVPHGTGAFGQAMALAAVGTLVAVAGLAILIAHAIWSRSQRPVEPCIKRASGESDGTATGSPDAKE